jgi:hypothetical protein
MNCRKLPLAGQAQSSWAKLGSFRPYAEIHTYRGRVWSEHTEGIKATTASRYQTYRRSHHAYGGRRYSENFGGCLERLFIAIDTIPAA